MKCVYYSFIYRYLMYCNHIWGNTYKTSLSKLQVLQNKAVRVITGSTPRTNTELLYNKSGLINLNDINLYLVGLFMHEIHQGNLPDVFGVNNHQNFLSFTCAKMSSCLIQTGIRYQGLIIWNKILMANINPDSSEACFKTMLKKAIQHKSICTDWTYMELCIDTSLMISHNFCALPAPVIIIKWSNCVPDMGPTNHLGFLPPFAIWLIFCFFYYIASELLVYLISRLATLFCLCAEFQWVYW